ncbi:MAG: protein phosphatase 2C domain-containing protein [Planctomycetaceae bacterium]|jgi:protein phosphatase|nr:protein phosphatase 2C domain-containing protein [Planctomycetaceae bacterium]
MDSIQYWKKSIRYSSVSDIGMRRSNNQDSFGVHISGTVRQWLLRGHLFVVADGMGAHAAGEVASKMAVDIIMQSYLKRTGEAACKALVSAVMDAHNRIRERSRRENAFHDMGTTCDAFAMTPQGIIIAHVGDSRVYRIRANYIEQMTFDHSLVWEVCAASKLSFDNPPYHIPKNQITRSLGPTENLRIDVEGPHRILVGDVFLSCSDGLTGQVKDYEIGEIVTVFPPDLAAETLVNITNLRGGPDNTTIIIAQATSDAKIEQEVDDGLKMPLKSIALICVTIIMVGVIFVASLLGDILVGIVAGSIAAAAIIAFFATTQLYLIGASPFAHTEFAGKAPYVCANCQPESNFANSLAKTLGELRNAIKEKKINITTKEADQKEQIAKNAIKINDYANAIRNYAMAINLLMRELRN